MNSYRLQGEESIRVVYLSNLEAMCERISGWCHRYCIDRVGRATIRVSYSNPDEYGCEHPIIAILPILPGSAEENNPRIAFDIVGILHDTEGEGWQHFLPLLDCPQLWRDSYGRWATREEIESRKEARMKFGKEDFPAYLCSECSLSLRHEIKRMETGVDIESCSCCGAKETKDLYGWVEA